MLPEALKVVKNNLSNVELVYLGLKVLWKTVHYEIPLDVKVLTNSWMETVLLTITLYIEEYQKNVRNYEKYSPEFYYFHSKKWAIRILLRYVQKHARQLSHNSEENKQYCRNWQQTYGPEAIDSVVLQMPISAI